MGKNICLVYCSEVCIVVSIKNGILQGSTMGCLLFLIYINDISRLININTNIIMFADDTNIINTGGDMKQAMQNVINTLKELKDWMIQNKLNINTNKTKYMIFKTKKGLTKETKQQLMYDNKELEEVNSIKFLGIKIDNELNFIKHIELVANSIKAIIPICYKLRDKLSDSTKKMLYYALIYSRISYGIEVYSNTSWNNLLMLDKIHKRIIKILYNENKYASMRRVYVEKQFLNLRHIISYHIIMIGYKWANNMLPNLLKKDILPQNQDNRTRQYSYIYKQQFTTNQEQKILSYRVSKYWNELPKNLKIQKYSEFKKQLKAYLLTSISNKGNGGNEDKYF